MSEEIKIIIGRRKRIKDCSACIFSRKTETMRKSSDSLWQKQRRIYYATNLERGF